MHAKSGGLPKTPDAPGGRCIMDAYMLIAGLSGVAVFCAVALKGFGQRRQP
jgi:hypothetical protein